MYVYYFFAALAIWFGIRSLRSGYRYAQYVRSECARSLADFTPFASIIAPCRGLDRGLKENIESLFLQDYPQYEIIFVTDHPNDPSVETIEEVRQSHASTPVPTTIVFAGEASDSGQKVHNLRVAVTNIDPQSDVLVFVDVDARPGKTWLRSLVEPLRHQSLGATTGYRWFLSKQGGLASQLLSIWNASIASALGDEAKKNFCWGGSTAITRSVFERLKIRERWRGTVSDDFTVMKVMREAKLPIKFVPRCLTASLEDYNFSQLLEFTTRQLQITRVYAPQFWRGALLGGLMFNSIFFGGVVLVVLRLLFGRPAMIPLIVVCVIFLLGTAKAYLRWKAVAIPLAEYEAELRKSFAAHILLWPFGASLFFYNAIVASFSRRIVWRGIGYELKSPTEAVIISRD
jgi:cellulose synthase/poly-beta-1,6-N-acetylglucosamine synthase-like glycosyltransferase